ncbi:lipopolysaccharide biosynthesis protein [Parvibaculum sp.]|jgi:O-antigen/teichoic acid export membrane protein|uniref:lipopolysaccharide biosynthesis protein n=1 Tax=Parvibaculum sp. TaxID=2024848 RepID=UPI003BAD076F
MLLDRLKAYPQIGRIFVQIERYRTLGKNSLWVFAAQLLIWSGGFLLSVIYAHYLPKDSLGTLQFVFGIMGVLSLASLPGFGTAIIQSTARGHRGTFRRGVKLSFICSVVVAFGLLVAGGWYYLAREDATLAYMFVAAGCVFPFYTGLTLWRSDATGLRRYSLLVLVNGVTIFISTSTAFVFLYMGYRDVPILFLISTLTISICNIVMSVLALREVPPDAEPEPGSVKYGVSTTLYSAVNNVGNHADSILLFTFLSPEAVAVYYIANRIPELFKDFFQQLRNVLIPELAKKSRLTLALKRKLNLLSLALFVFSLCIIAVLPFAFRVIYPEGYANSVIYCQLIMLSVAFANFTIIQKSFIEARLDRISIRNITLISSSCRLVLSVVLVPFYGIAGAVGSTIVYRLIAFGYVNYLVRRAAARDEG